MDTSSLFMGTVAAKVGQYSIVISATGSILQRDRVELIANTSLAHIRNQDLLQQQRLNFNWCWPVSPPAQVVKSAFCNEKK